MAEALLGPDLQQNSGILPGFGHPQGMIGVEHRTAIDLGDDVPATQASFMGGRVFRYVNDNDPLNLAGERQLSACEDVQIANDSSCECSGWLPARRAASLDFNLGAFAAFLMDHVDLEAAAASSPAGDFASA